MGKIGHPQFLRCHPGLFVGLLVGLFVSGDSSSWEMNPLNAGERGNGIFTGIFTPRPRHKNEGHVLYRKGRFRGISGFLQYNPGHHVHILLMRIPYIYVRSFILLVMLKSSKLNPTHSNPHIHTYTHMPTKYTCMHAHTHLAGELTQEKSTWRYLR